MKTLIYMSEELKKPRMDINRSTIIQQGSKIKYAGPLRIVDKQGNTLAELKLNPEGNPETPEHHVKAWIETECEVKC